VEPSDFRFLMVRLRSPQVLDFGLFAHRIILSALAKTFGADEQYVKSKVVKKLNTNKIMPSIDEMTPFLTSFVRSRVLAAPRSMFPAT
jgi:hypothetical protein